MCVSKEHPDELLSGSEFVPLPQAVNLRIDRYQLNNIPKSARKVDARLPAKGNSKSHGARPVHQIFFIIVWIRTSRLSIKKSLSTSTRQVFAMCVSKEQPDELLSGSETLHPSALFPEP